LGAGYALKSSGISYFIELFADFTTFTTRDFRHFEKIEKVKSFKANDNCLVNLLIDFDKKKNRF